MFSEDEDLDRMLVFQKSSVYKTLSKRATKVLYSSNVCLCRVVFSQSGFRFGQPRASMSKKMLQMLPLLKCNKSLR